jgi:hypothetical protein
MSLGQLKRSEDRALESPRPLQPRNGSPGA